MAISNKSKKCQQAAHANNESRRAAGSVLSRKREPQIEQGGKVWQQDAPAGRHPAVTTARTSTHIAFSVWKALFLREAVSRISAGRAAWLWLLVEPLVHVVFLLFVFTTIRMRTVGGIETAVWLMVGMLAFLMFRRTGTRTQNAVSSNQGLFTYRQVKPVDTVLVRAALEGFLMLLVAIILFSGTALFGIDIIPDDPLAVLEAFLGLWLVGVGFGLCASVAGELIPEIGKLIGFIMMPMYLISGVIYPIASVPQPYRDWLMLNPVAHGLEAARLGFASYYHAVPELSIAYLYGFALVATFFGLALHVHFQTRLIAR